MEFRETHMLSEEQKKQLRKADHAQRRIEQAANKEYIDNVINSMIEKMVIAVMNKRPVYPCKFLKHWLIQYNPVGTVNQITEKTEPGVSLTQLPEADKNLN